MAVRKICKPKGCRGSPRCDHPWWFDVMHSGKRWRMRVDEFAIARGASEPITSKQTAERVWEPKFIAELMAGKDPRVSPLPQKQDDAVLTVATFLDRYYTMYVEAEGLKSADTVAGHIKALKAALGELPVVALEKPVEIARFKAVYRHGHAVATVNRALGVLRAAINWGRFQDPPLLATSPFHRFGVNIKVRDETKRDRRIHREEEQSLLAACLMNTDDQRSTGPAMHDRIIGALETCCRQGEMLRIQNRDVDWTQHSILIRAENAKDNENRRIPFDPKGRLAPILKRRGELGPYAFVFGTPEGEFQESFKTAWEFLLVVAHGHPANRPTPKGRVDREKLKEIDLHWHDLRHEGACRLLADGVDIRVIQLMLGHSDIKTTQRYLNITDEEMRRALNGVWERRRQLRLETATPNEHRPEDQAVGE
jgi:integrase